MRSGRDLRRFSDAKAAHLVGPGNFLIASVIESLGEAIALVSKAGIDRRQISTY